MHAKNVLHRIEKNPQSGTEAGRFSLQLADGSEAEMTYRPLGEKTIIIDHTFVPPQFRGHSVADQLMQAAIEHARSHNLKITPVCSYAQLAFRRHPEWRDLLTAD